MLDDHDWKLKYTPEDGDLVRRFYIPALEDAERYDRLTGYFNASALALAARGIEGLVRNDGHMRLVVGCTLEPPEIEAIGRGVSLREQVEKRLRDLPLAPPDADAAGALELLAWMVARGHLDVKVAVPCDASGMAVHDSAIFHEKAGIIADRAGNRIAWNGSLNETAAGWQRNWESINVFTSWGPEDERVYMEERNFARLWANQTDRALVLEVPDAVRRDLMRFLPSDDDLPARLKADEPCGPDDRSVSADSRGAATQTGDVPGRRNGSAPGAGASSADRPTDSPEPGAGALDHRALVWSFIERAASLPGGGSRVGGATAAVTPWPHQVRAFERLYERWPPKLLIADEVGLGKTIQAGLLLRQAWLAGRARRILILAPKAVLRQWQIELREKFNLNWPIYDGRRLVRYPSPALRETAAVECEVDRARWHEEPAVIASSQLMRRRDRAAELLEVAEPWDLVVLDEAHHARRRAAGARQEGGPNALLRLMRALKTRTQGLLLLTATPMQVHPVEVWDLLDLLGLPAEWTADAFLGFFEDVQAPSPSPAALERMARLFRAVERDHGEVTGEVARRLTGLSRLKAGKVLRALRDAASIPRRQLETAERRAAIALMRAHTPVKRLVSRHTRELLRRYFSAGMLSAPIAGREVEDRFLDLTPAERALYRDVETYIADTYDRVSGAERSAVGFVMTIYRRRLASSFAALARTFEKRLGTMESHPRRTSPLDLDEDMPDDETTDEIPEADDIAAMEHEALAFEEREEIASLLDRIRALPPDSKLVRLTDALAELRREGHAQVMVFTQYTDTMDFLRDALRSVRQPKPASECLYGRASPALGAFSSTAGPDPGTRPGERLQDGRSRAQTPPEGGTESNGGSVAGGQADGSGQALRLMCYSGRGGEVPSADGASWRGIGRDDAKRRFREGEADVLLCTDAAAEGLNFQFCGALVNYDMPWNPMRVEQRIGRIDRLGQVHSTIRIVNLHYEGTVETDVYRALRERIGLFESVVGRLQPILAKLPQTIADAVLSGGERDNAGRANVVDTIERRTREAEAGGFDIDEVLDDDFAMPARKSPAFTGASSPLTLDDLDRVIATPALMPPGVDVQPLGRREYGLLAPGMAERVRVTTDPAYYEAHAESVELWSPGNPLFTAPEFLSAQVDEWPPGTTLKDLLEQ